MRGNKSQIYLYILYVIFNKFSKIYMKMHKYLQFSTDEAAFFYSLSIPHIIEIGLLRVRISFFLITNNFKVYKYNLNFLCFWFLLVICQCIWMWKKRILFSQIYQSLSWILDYISEEFFLYPRAAISLLKKQGEKKGKHTTGFKALLFLNSYFNKDQ